MSVRVDLTDEQRIEAFLESLYREEAPDIQGTLLEFEPVKPRLLRWFETKDSTEDGAIEMISLDAITSVTRLNADELAVTTRDGDMWYTEDPNTIERFWAEWEVV